MNRFVSKLLGCGTALVMTGAAHAAVIITTDSNGGNGNPGYTVSSSDLINGLSPTASAGNFSREDGAGNALGTAAFTNGVFGNSTTSDLAQSATAGAGATHGTSVTYTLPASTLGWDITGISSYGAWGDSGRDEQSYTLSFAPLSNITAFTPVATVLFNPPGAFPGSNTMVTITDDSGILGTAVGAVKFDFNATENGWSGYRELDVIGTSTVPEPSTYAALAGIAVVVLAIARRRRS